jgi:hypothetical protein
MYRQGDGDPFDFHHDGGESKRRDENTESKLEREQRLLDEREALLNKIAKPSIPPHFRWKWAGKRHRLTLCVGGKEKAAWPGKDDGYMLALIRTKMFIGEGREPLSRDQRKIKRMMVKLRDALLRAEDGPRHRKAYPQRVRVERLLGLNKPITTVQAAMWTCDCEVRNRYALSVESCLYCHKKAPRQRKSLRPLGTPQDNS